MKKNIIICGSSGALGNFIFKKLKKNKSYRCIGLSRTKKNLESNYTCDFLSFSNLKTVLMELKKKYKKIDGVIFCIGQSKKKYKDIDHLKFWRSSLDDNFLVFVNFLNAFKNIFKRTQTKIIIMSSIAGIKIIDAPITYAVSKAALNFYSKSKAKSLAKDGIQLNIISLGNIYQSGNNWDKKIKKNKKNVLNYINENVPSKKFCTPEEIYELCLTLLKSNNSNFYGSNIVLDGGQSL